MDTQEMRDEVRRRAVHAAKSLGNARRMFGSAFSAVHGGRYRADLERESQFWLAVWKATKE